MLKEYFKKWKKRSTTSKVSDIIFFLFIAMMLIPQGRMAFGGFINNIKSKISQPALMEEKLTLNETTYQWQLTDLRGEAKSLKETKGKVLFINLWATWCPPCVGEMPALQKMVDRFEGEENIEFMMISGEDPETIKKFIEKKGYTFPVYSTQFPTPSDLQSKSIPTSYLISKKGEIVLREVGAMNWGGDKMEQIIRQMLDE